MSGVFLGPVIEYLLVYTIAQSCTIPAQSPFFTAQFAFQNPYNFLFFPHPVRRPVCYLLPERPHMGSYFRKFTVIVNNKVK